MIDVMNCFASENYLNRPLIIQLKVERSGSTNIFYKECRVNGVKLVQLPKVSQIKNETFGENLNFEVFLHQLKSNIGGTFTGDNLLSCEINLLDCPENAAFVNWATESHSSLLIRFLKLFIKKETGQPAIVNAIRISTPDTLAALLDFSINTEDCSSNNLNNDQIESFTISAVESGKIEMLQFLLRLVFMREVTSNRQKHLFCM